MQTVLQKLDQNIFMKRISVWAYHHKWLSWLLIGVCHVLLIILAFFIADISAFKISTSIEYSLLSVATITAVYYPGRDIKQLFKNYYRTQKTADFTLLLTGFLLMICLFTKLLHQQQLPVFAQNAFSSVPAKINTETLFKTNGNNKIRPEAKARKTFRHQLNQIRKAYKGMSKGEKAVLIALTIIAGTFLLSVVAAAACSLSCSGSQFLAALVAIVGEGAIIFGVIKLIQAIGGKKKNKIQANAPEKSESI